MKHTLTLTGSSAALAAAMTAFESVEKGAIHDTLSGETYLPGNAPSTSTGTGTAAPTPIPSAPISAVPMPPAPTPISGEDDEADEASDGSGTDSTGLPWDARIHSTPAAKTNKGVWRKRRGLDDATFATVSAELRAAQGQAPTLPPAAPQPLPAPTPPMPTATAETAPIAPPPLPTPEPAAAPQPLPTPMPTVPEPLPVPTPTPTPEPAAAEQQWDFATLMQAIGPKMGEGEGQINAAYLATVCGVYGLNSITDLAPQPEKIPQVVAQFQVDGRW